MPSAPAAERIAFPSASAVSPAPLATVSLAFAGDLMTYSATPELLKTVAAVATPIAGASTTAARSKSAPIATFTGAANAILATNGVAFAGAVGVAAFLV